MKEEKYFPYVFLMGQFSLVPVGLILAISFDSYYPYSLVFPLLPLLTFVLVGGLYEFTDFLGYKQVEKNNYEYQKDY